MRHLIIYKRFSNLNNSDKSEAYSNMLIGIYQQVDQFKEIKTTLDFKMIFSTTSIPQYDLPQSPILIIGFFGIFFTLVLLYFVNRAYFDSPLNDDKRG